MNAPDADKLARLSHRPPGASPPGQERYYHASHMQTQYPNVPLSGKVPLICRNLLLRMSDMLLQIPTIPAKAPKSDDSWLSTSSGPICEA